MQSNFYVSLSGEVAVDKRLTTIANNVANMNTAGYRADGVDFATVMSNTGNDEVAFSDAGNNYISRRSGEITKTDNPLDVAIQGDAWLGIKTPTGIAYTHDGRMKISATGDLQTLSNNSVLDAGGAPLTLDPNAGPVAISEDGMMTQNGHQVGAIGLFSIDKDAKLTRTGNSGVIPDKAATPVLDFSTSGMEQGFVEGSNINPILEMAKLINVQHAMSQMNEADKSADSMMQEAVKTLGATS